ncbi:lycopene cyclase domain-containing protein [Galbibacter sp. BG1]|uniref:lycopene cyclase domain-containing protein n=1 Tax=Galbibacter sp. BG1 TaxID=1170699 RepID=UPI0015BFE302|nr:lycopene cyclase domain-containing protein [Galbibacter sp. BG1]QLE01932.1 lycopene cyclase domain-containing protein [Galbibacter sp. BG1]
MEKYLYLILDIFSFIVPFAVSFERKRLHFIRFWKPYFLAILLVGLFFIAWDVFFTIEDVWGFNDRYLVGWDILHLPIEEWLFFLLIPYASNFIHYSLLYLFPKPKLRDQQTIRIAGVLFVTAVLIAVVNFERIYTLCSFGLFALLMLLQLIYRFKELNRYLLSFLIILVPFFIVNSWLTGSFTEEPIVYYNDMENLGIRLGTIPVEDIFYCFSLLYGSVLLFEYFKKKEL